MHDGSYDNLESIIDNYNNGGFTHANKSPLIRPLHLEEQEKADLIAFLHTLTDRQFIRN